MSVADCTEEERKAWDMFVAAALSNGTIRPTEVALVADSLLLERRSRFPVCNTIKNPAVIPTGRPRPLSPDEKE